MQAVDGQAMGMLPSIAPAAPPSSPAASRFFLGPTQAPTYEYTGQLPDPAKAPDPRVRFQRGQVDEVTFLAPELGPLVGVLVGTECATWGLKSVDISSSRTSHTDRFECFEVVGGTPGMGAAWLTPAEALPVPREQPRQQQKQQQQGGRRAASTWSPGPAPAFSSQLSKQQQRQQAPVKMQVLQQQQQPKQQQAIPLRFQKHQQQLRKQLSSSAARLDADTARIQLLSTTLALVTAGTLVSGLAAGIEGAMPFMLGGSIGLANLVVMQVGRAPPDDGTWGFYWDLGSSGNGRRHLS